MSLLIASVDKNDLVSEQKRVKRNADGDSGAGISSARISTEDLIKLGETVNECDKKAVKDMRYIPLAIYAQAMARDAYYALQGRKFMRAMSLNTRYCAAYNRAYMIESAVPKS